MAAIMFFSARYAFKRLILHFKPPLKIKTK
jgi:hypothetical protein